ncbi:MAG: creatininase family protein [Chloroflexota bacterium]
MAREVRLERLHPAEVRAAMADAPVAWVPWGAIEFHAEHLPFGTDGFSAQQIVERAARIAGGVVLPWTALTFGTLHLDWTLRYDKDLVEKALRQTIQQLAAFGARVVVVHTGHGPLDLDHLIKRVCGEIQASDETSDDFRAYGLCYLELNAALGTGLGSDWPVALDHGSIMETSWVMAMEPDLVHLNRLPEDPDVAGIVGIYGPNPRTSVNASVAAGQIDAAAGLLAERVRGLLAGERLDPMADLRTFVERYWPEALEITGRAGGEGEAKLLVTNPAPVSRYLTAIELTIDGQRLQPATIGLRNQTIGEAGALVAGDELGPEAGFYVRRQQSAEILLPAAVSPGIHHVVLKLGLAGVTDTNIGGEVTFK